MKTMTSVPAFLAILCIGLFSTGLAQGGLVQYWALEETSGTTSTTNEVASGNTGTMVNFSGNPWVTDTPTALAHSSGSLDFESGNTQWVNGNAIHVSSTGAGGGATVSMWMKPESLSNENRPFSQANRGGAEVGGATRIYNDGLLGVWGGYPGTGYQTLAPASTIQTGTWQHVLFSWSGDTVSAYVDGQFTGSAPSNFDYDKQGTTDLQFGIGSRYGGSGHTFDGLVDDVAIFNQPLGSHQLQSLADGTSPSDISCYSQVVNVDLQNGSSESLRFSDLGAAEGWAENTHWELVNAAGGYSGSNLLASDGSTATSIGVTIDQFVGATDGYAHLTGNVLQGDRVYVSSTSAVGEFTIDGLDPSQRYDIYLYASEHSTLFTLDGMGAGKSTAWAGPKPSSVWREGVDYVVFQNISGVPLIEGTFDVGPTSYGSLSGVQIAQVVPEPCSIGLLAIGLMGLIGVRRRRK